MAPKLPHGTNSTRFCTRNNMCTRIDTNLTQYVHEMSQFAKYIYIYNSVKKMVFTIKIPLLTLRVCMRPNKR